MLTKDFAYTLPDNLIARYPTSERTGSRLLVLNPQDGSIADQQFPDILNLLNPGDLLVLNNSKVLKARMFGYKFSGGKIEMLIERLIDENNAWAHVRASKSPKPGTWLLVGNNIRIQVQDFDAKKSLYRLKFATATPILDILNIHGEIPLPPYFNRAAELSDLERYQTVYALNPGSVAAPTAGLHFNDTLLDALKAKGINVGQLTLHVGAGTFQPVRVENLADHKMHSESMQIDAELCEQIIATKQRGNRVICVGTTAVRALESAARNGELQAQTCDTDIFITPGYKFKLVDAMITNFHLPESTLLMLVSAFAGKDNIFAAYNHAIEKEYRFYSYGDAMFITGRQDAV